MWVAIVWEIWNHKNKIVFKNEVVDADEIFCLAQLKGWTWSKFKEPRVNFFGLRLVFVSNPMSESCGLIWLLFEYTRVKE